MSELRQDLVSGDWVIIAPGRATRPDSFRATKTVRKPGPKRTCPFEDLAHSGNPIIASYPARTDRSQKRWQIAVIPNKYPALAHANGCAVPLSRGIYAAMTGVGSQELIVTRDHDTPFTALAPSMRTELFRIFQERHRLAAKDKCLVYATTFFNYGPSAGSSLWHPHYQFAALPFIPPHAMHSEEGSEAYFKKRRRCARCDMIREEQKVKIRVIAENATAIAFAPFASKRPFEVTVVPKRHEPFFWNASPRVLADSAHLLQTVLQRIKRNAGDPDLNFFIHDAAYDGKMHAHHHWHIEVMPNISRLGGLEFSTGMYVNVVEPETAAAVLRGQKVLRGRIK